MKRGEKVLELETRKRIHGTILEQPGICIRELERTLGMAIGELTYHLPLLLENNLIKEESDSYFRRFFPFEMSKKEIKTLTFLRREAVRGAIPLFLAKSKVTNKDLVKALSIRASTASWHIKRMMANGIIIEKETEGKKSYVLKDRKAVSYIYKM